MNIKAMKMTGLSIALATAFLVAAGAAGASIAFAQDHRWRDRDYDVRIDSRRQRVQTQDVASVQERRGFNDGLIIGRRDALARFSFNPSCSTRYQLGGFYYRQGFQRGYAQSYRQNANNYGNRNNERYVRDNSHNRDGYRNEQYRQPGYYDRFGNYYYY